MAREKRYPCSNVEQYHEYLFALFGCLATLYVSIAITYYLYRFVILFVVCRFSPSVVENERGRWAVVTGGNSGIGRSYALQLAKNGMNLIIVAKTEETLRVTAEEVRKTYGVECCYVTVDLRDDNAIVRVAEALRDKDVTVLINNAGIIGNIPCFFLSETERNLVSMVNLHASTVVMLTQLILPTMLRKNRGYVVTVSSFSSIYPAPSLSHYSSCKAFSDRFTRALSYEYANVGIHIQSLIPDLVSTRIIKFIRFKFVIPSSDVFAADAVRTLGASSYTTGYWMHEVMWHAIHCIPGSLRIYLVLKFSKKIKDLFSKYQ